MGSIEPTAEQLEAFFGIEDDGGPLAMINLLRYREQAEYGDDSSEAPCTGREAYMRYGAVAGQTVARFGGEIVTGGPAVASVIAPADEVWDDFVLIRYPSRQAFLDMIGDPEYLTCVHHRSAALADSRLIATRSGDLFSGK